MVKVLDLIRKEKKQTNKQKYAKVAKIYGENEPSVCETAEKEEEPGVGLAVARRPPKVTTAVREQCSEKLEQALGPWDEGGTCTWLTILLATCCRKAKGGPTGCHWAHAILSLCLAT